MESIKIIATSILLAIIYGIGHDLITAHISIEYFTVGHPIIIQSESPIKIALLWGVIATWWLGLILGILVSITARIGHKPKLKLTDIFPQLKVLLIIITFTALCSGLIGYALAKTEIIFLSNHLAAQIAPERHHLFLTAGWSHAASYLTGIIGSLIICFRIWKQRKEKRNTKYGSELRS